LRNAVPISAPHLLADGRVLVAGGFGIEDMPTNVELYDPTTGIWTSTIPLITSRRGHSVFRLANGKAVIVGGFNFNAGGASANAELYDPAAAVPAPLLLTDAARLPSGAFSIRFQQHTRSQLQCFQRSRSGNDGWGMGEPRSAHKVLAGIYEFTDSSAPTVANLLPSTLALIECEFHGAMIALLWI